MVWMVRIHGWYGWYGYMDGLLDGTDTWMVSGYEVDLITFIPRFTDLIDVFPFDRCF